MVKLLDLNFEVGHRRPVQGLRQDRAGRRPAALLPGPAAARRPGDRSPSGAAGLHRDLRDIRPDYGSTSTILTEHLRAVDIDISERTATAMLYAIKSDTLFFNRQANSADLDAFSYLYPLADATMIRKMEGVGNHRRAARLRDQGVADRAAWWSTCSARSSASRRARTSSPTSPTSTCSSRTCSGRSCRGVVNDTFVVSVRNLGYSRNAGDFVRRWFNDIGSAGGHRTMAKAVVPLEAFQRKFGTSEGIPHQPAHAGTGARVPARSEAGAETQQK